MTRARRGLAGLLAFACAALPGCGGPPERDAVERAVGYFAREVEAPDPRWASLFGYLHRRFGLEVTLADGSHPYGADLLAAFAASGDPTARIYRRLEDPDASVGRRAVADLPTPIDRITATGLHCDHVGLPPDWIDVLREAARAGGYGLTHSVVALQWTLENGCLPPVAAVALQAEQSERLRALIERRHELADHHDVATDMWIEALVMLQYLGDGERVRRAWIDDLLALQRPDGGWPNHPDAPRSHPHPTALALWALLETLEPDAPRIAWIPGR